MINEICSWIILIGSSSCLILGALCSLAGGWGLVRLPDFYSRLHAGGITDTAGAGLILLGLMISSGLNLTTVKLFMIFFFFIVTSPSACHGIVRAAIFHGLKPELDEQHH